MIGLPLWLTRTSHLRAGGEACPSNKCFCARAIDPREYSSFSIKEAIPSLSMRIGR